MLLVHKSLKHIQWMSSQHAIQQDSDSCSVLALWMGENAYTASTLQITEYAKVGLWASLRSRFLLNWIPLTQLTQLTWESWALSFLIFGFFFFLSWLLGIIGITIEGKPPLQGNSPHLVPRGVGVTKSKTSTFLSNLAASWETKWFQWVNKRVEMRTGTHSVSIML